MPDNLTPDLVALHDAIEQAGRVLDKLLDQCPGGQQRALARCHLDTAIARALRAVTESN